MRARRRFAKTSQIPSAPSPRRGAMIVLLSALMIILLMAVAFSVDVAFMQLSRTRLRISTDAAARAAGESLTRTQNVPMAIQAARDLAAENPVAGAPLLLDDQDIIVGNAARQANGSWAFSANGTPINSIRVVGRRTRDSLSGSIPLFFGRVFHVSDFETTQTATAVRMDRDICLVVDRSSSMKLAITDTTSNMSSSNPRFCSPPYPDTRWAALASAVQTFITALGTTPQVEHVGLASFGSNFSSCGINNVSAQINQPINANQSLVNTAMSAISATSFNGNTNIAAGVQKGIDALTDPSTTRPYAMKTMVFLTDGIRTEGGNPLPLAQIAKNNNIVIHTITFGDSADPTEMSAVAEATGGKYYHAPNAQRLQEIFHEIALSLLVTLTE